MPRSSLDHAGEEWHPGIGNTKKIDPYDPLPVLSILFPKWTTRTNHTGVGNHNVDAPELSLDALCERSERSAIGNVYDPGHDRSAGLGQLINKFVKRRFLHVCERYSQSRLTHSRASPSPMPLAAPVITTLDPSTKSIETTSILNWQAPARPVPVRSSSVSIAIRVQPR